MTPGLDEIAAPGHTAIVTQECQGAVVGPDAGLEALAEEARREAVPNIERLLPVARRAGVTVVHCLVQRRPDGRGANHNAKIFRMSRATGDAIAPGTPGAELLPELGPEPSDVVLRRWHGIGPMGGTDLDAVLRRVPRRRPPRRGGGHPHRLRECDHRQHVVAAGDDHDHRRVDRHMEVAAQ